MKRQLFTLMILGTATSAFAQEPAARGGGRGEAPQPAPLFFKETWKEAPGNVPVTQAFVVNPDLQLNIYGAARKISASPARGMCLTSGPDSAPHPARSR